MVTENASNVLIELWVSFFHQVGHDKLYIVYFTVDNCSILDVTVMDHTYTTLLINVSFNFVLNFIGTVAVIFIHLV